MSLPAIAAGKQAWITMLKQRHADAAKAASVDAVQATTWDELAAHTQWSALGDAKTAAADSRALLSLLMRRWYQARHRSIRQRDTHHLILGDKLTMNRDREFPVQIGGLRQPYIAAMKKGDAKEVANYEQRGALHREGFITAASSRSTPS